MAIQLNYTNPATALNAPASYSLVKTAFFDYINNQVQFTVGVWWNAAAKTALKDPMFTKDYTLPFATLGVTGSSTQAQLATAVYNWLLVPANEPFYTGGSSVA